jgi:hypothetical protein
VGTGMTIWIEILNYAISSYFLTDVFIRMNGYKQKVVAKEAHKFIITYIEGTDRKLAPISHWIKANIVKI